MGGCFVAVGKGSAFGVWGRGLGGRIFSFDLLVFATATSEEGEALFFGSFVVGAHDAFADGLAVFVLEGKSHGQDGDLLQGIFPGRHELLGRGAFGLLLFFGGFGGVDEVSEGFV